MQKRWGVEEEVEEEEEAEETAAAAEKEDEMWETPASRGLLHLHGCVDSREDCVPSKHKGQEAKGHGEVIDVNGVGAGQLQHVHTDRGVEDSGSCKGGGGHRHQMEGRGGRLFDRPCLTACIPLPLFLSLSLSVFILVPPCLSLSVSVYLSVCLYPSVSLSLSLSISVALYVCLPVLLPVNLRV